MVTPGNVLVPPIWHFILLHHPLPSAFPSPHTGITLIMIIAVMIMITTAKLRSLSHIQHPGDYDWLKGCLQMFPSSPRSLFVSFFFYLFGFFILFLLSPLISHSLSSSPLVSLQSFSIFWQSFISVVVLLSTFPGPSNLRHLSPALSFLTPAFQPLICSLLRLFTFLLSCLLILLLQRNKINLLFFCHIALRK